MRKLVPWIILTVLLTGCARRQVAPVVWPTYSQAEYDALPTTGDGVVKGQIFMKTKGGDVKKGAGEVIVLRPATNYAARVRALSSQNGLGYVDYLASARDLSVVSDGEGRFEFKNVPPGEYFAAGKVAWSVFYPGTFAPIESKQGGNIVMKVSVVNGQVSEVMLTR
jgi:hypothetical protein